MKAFRLFFLLLCLTLLLKIGILPAQNCAYWSEPVPLSDSLSDNHNATLVNIPGGSSHFYVFWDRLMEDYSSEIVYIDIYNPDVPQLVVSGDGSTLSNPQVIPLSYGNPPADSLACVFYQAYGGGVQYIYYVVMTDAGFTAPVPFASSIFNELHFRVSPGGGIVWEQDGNILFTRLHYDNAGLYFEPYVYIDTEECRNPDIQNTDFYTQEQYIAWEKGSPDNPEIWYSSWSYENNAWGAPVLLFDDGHHSNLMFSKGIDLLSGAFPVLVSDKVDSTGQYQVSGYDFSFQDEFISEFTQSEAFQPDLFLNDLITGDYWEMGYLAFSHVEEGINSDIFSSDEGWLQPEFFNYCRIDSTSQPDENPQLFQGAWHGNYFDLFCIWESWRYGPWQLFYSSTPVTIGNVPETSKEGDLKARAYPDPFSDFLWLEYESGTTSDVRVSILNTFGQLVKTTDDKILSNGKNLLKIETGNLPAGIYLVRIDNGNSMECLKVVKR
jgi:hypothetical protein